MEKFHSRRGLGKISTTHSQESRQVSLEIVDLNFPLLGERGALFCVSMKFQISTGLGQSCV